MRVAFSVAVSVVTAVAARFSTIGASVAAALLETSSSPVPVMSAVLFVAAEASEPHVPVACTTLFITS